MISAEAELLICLKMQKSQPRCSGTRIRDIRRDVVKLTREGRFLASPIPALSFPSHPGFSPSLAEHVIMRYECSLSPSAVIVKFYSRP
jgi:hypothetical protein